MKKIILGTGCFIFACVLLLIFLNPFGNKNNEKAADHERNVKPGLVYIVKDYGGNIAVFEEGKDKPFRITDVPVDELPDADKELLEKGLTANNQEELNLILEDYCS